jgi:hypothetical protein
VHRAEAPVCVSWADEATAVHTGWENGIFFAAFSADRSRVGAAWATRRARREHWPLGVSWRCTRGRVETNIEGRSGRSQAHVAGFIAAITPGRPLRWHYTQSTAPRSTWPNPNSASSLHNVSIWRCAPTVWESLTDSCRSAWHSSPISTGRLR